jgi:hypothetical protein
VTEGEHYAVWIDAVFGGVADTLGGDRTQTGSDRTFGDGRFSHSGPKDGMGDVTFRVLLPHHPLRPNKPCGPFEWRAYPDPLIISNQVLEVYRDLKSHG